MKLKKSFISWHQICNKFFYCFTFEFGMDQSGSSKTKDTKILLYAIKIYIFTLLFDKRDSFQNKEE